MMDNLRELYQQLILDHNKNPRNFRPLSGADRQVEGYNPLCGDKITLYLNMDDGGIITDVSFQGSGCAISRASASLMTEIVKGKSVAEAQILFEEFHELATTGGSREEALGKLMALADVHKFPARVKCAVLPWHTLVSAMKGELETVTTE